MSIELFIIEWRFIFMKKNLKNHSDGTVFEAAKGAPGHSLAFYGRRSHDQILNEQTIKFRTSCHLWKQSGDQIRR